MALTQVQGGMVASGTITSNNVSFAANSISGSALTANTVSNTAFQTGSVENYMSAQGFGLGMRNRIINGDMRIDQRNAGAAVTANNNTNNYTLDRWNTYGQPTDGVFTVQQVSDAPAGFINSLKVTVTTADASIGAGQSYAIRYSIEGVNVSDFAWGSSSASTATLSFWVKSSITGVFSVGAINDGYSRSYPTTFTINSANTWEYKTITITGDTTGTWLTNTSTGIRLWWSLGSGTKSTANIWNAGTSYTATGSVDLISTLNATFQLTGVQLEKGSVATPFEYRQYGQELALCQRYCQRIGSATGNFCGLAGSSSVYTSVPVRFAVEMRASPSVTFLNQPSNSYAGSTNTGEFRLDALQATIVGPLQVIVSSEL